MNSARQQEIFAAALGIADAAGREAMLASACADNPELRAQLTELLASHAGAEQFFSHCSLSIVASAGELPLPGELADAEAVSPDETINDAIGSRVGAYKLLQKIGEGGWGVVYMAEQEKPVRRRVALKIIKLGMDTKSVIARFEAERQALAMMDHPNIARVLDAGATETGRPYFVMELVNGIRITRYCDERQLDPRQRLELFIQVCHAIQHAHQKGVIHRDIKPSNILVTLHDGVPVPKVIDFGIAKAVEDKLTDKTLFTMHGQFIGTPAYMSPEQADFSGLDIDTRSDIYSLGVLLYELLTGKTPFAQNELLASGLQDLSRTLRESEPRRPSTRLATMPAAELTMTAQHRHIEALQLRLLLAGDLDWIVMKALEKDRNRRYDTANGLAMDIQRYLNDEPVVARPPSRWYRFQKLVRRNRAVFSAASAVVLGLMLGLGVATWELFKERELLRRTMAAEQQAQQARGEESRLRGEADARAEIAKSAVLLSRGKLAEADALVEKIQIPVTEPSLEAAGVFRQLAVWNVTQGRWPPAADRFLKLFKACQVDKSDLTDLATWDLLKIGPTLIVAGETTNYFQFVQETITRFAGTGNPVAAEQVVKIASLEPANPATLRSLLPLADLLAKSVPEEGVDWGAAAYMLAWRTFALSLFEYRRGDFTNAVTWGQRSLRYGGARPTCVAMCHLVLAMAQHQLGEVDAARLELAQGQKLVQASQDKGLEKSPATGDDYTGLWHDWLIAQILLAEATRVVEGPTGAAN